MILSPEEKLEKIELQRGIDHASHRLNPSKLLTRAGKREENQREYWERELRKELHPIEGKPFSHLVDLQDRIENYRNSYRVATYCRAFVECTVHLLMTLDIMDHDYSQMLCTLYGNSLGLFHNPCGYIELKVEEGQKLTVSVERTLTSVRALFEAERKDTMDNCMGVCQRLSRSLYNKRSKSRGDPSQDDLDEKCSKMCMQDVKTQTPRGMDETRKRWRDSNFRFAKHEGCKEIVNRIVYHMAMQFGNDEESQQSGDDSEQCPSSP